MASKVVKPSSPLNDKQDAFCTEYIVDLHVTNSTIRAGYSKKTAYSIGSELLKKPEIQSRIQELMSIRAKKVEINANYILKNIIEIGERCMEKTAVMYFDKEKKQYLQDTVMVKNEDGSLTEEGIWKFDANGALKAQELLGKHIKLFTDVKVDHIHSGEITVKQVSITDRIESLKGNRLSSVLN